MHILIPHTITTHKHSLRGGGNKAWRSPTLAIQNELAQQFMETVFVLGAESRARFVERAAASIAGCAHVCLWAPLPARPPSSSHLVCSGAWLGGDGGGGDRVRALFDAYRGSLCAVVSGCVPGWAYRDGRAYMEMSGSDLATSASLQVQQQFYQEAGIKRAVFMGCQAGEIEIGMSAAAGEADLRANVEQVFSEDFLQQCLMEELLQLPPTRPTSSSSSLLSLSVGSPEYSSLVRTMASTPPLAESPHEMLQAYSMRPGGHVRFPSPESDDAAMARAMLAVISASSSSSMPPLPPPRTSPRPRPATAFRAYNAALRPRAAARGGVPGQRMIKTSMSILRRMHMARHAMASPAPAPAPEEAAPRPPTSSQLHHMVSERRRREKLNESFQALRSLLPPGTKKDKATVLARTAEYMNTLIAQVSDLAEKNRRLEAQVRRRAGEMEGAIAGSSAERVQVDVAGGSSAPSSSSSEPREVHVSVVVREQYCDLSALLIRVLERLKQMGDFAVVSVDAGTGTRQSAGVALHANLTLRVMAGECDESSLKEAVTKAVEDTLAPPPPPSPS